jgi:hypothetical protein
VPPTLLSYGDRMGAAHRSFTLPVLLAAVVATGTARALAQSEARAGASRTVTLERRGTVRATSTTRTPAGPPMGTAAEQTHPSVLPRRGHPHTRFTAGLTLAVSPGHSGVLSTDYRLQVSVKRRHGNARCSPPPPPILDAGSAGQRVHLALTAPESGWCVGRYTLTVLLQRGPYCPAPTPGQPPPPCPEFATQDLDVGHAGFLVTSRR